MGKKTWDKANPINHGVLLDEWGGSANGVMLRRVTAQAPDSGEIRVFLTTEMTLPPGPVFDMNSILSHPFIKHLRDKH